MRSKLQRTIAAGPCSGGRYVTSLLRKINRALNSRCPCATTAVRLSRGVGHHWLLCYWAQRLSGRGSRLSAATTTDGAAPGCTTDGDGSAHRVCSSCITFPDSEWAFAAAQPAVLTPSNNTCFLPQAWCNNATNHGPLPPPTGRGLGRQQLPDRFRLARPAATGAPVEVFIHRTIEFGSWLLNAKVCLGGSCMSCRRRRTVCGSGRFKGLVVRCRLHASGVRCRCTALNSRANLTRSSWSILLLENS